MLKIALWLSLLLTLFAIGGRGLLADSSHQQDLSFEALDQLIQKNGIKSIDQLLSALKSDPRYSSYRQNYVLAYSSQSIQCASFSQPRVISAGQDAKFMLTFSLSKDPKCPQTLEAIEFDNKTGKFEMRDYSPGKGSNLRPSEASPERCLACHKSDPRPNWAPYDLWAGIYAHGENPPGTPFVETLKFSPAEAKDFNQQFKPTERTSRASFLAFDKSGYPTFSPNKLNSEIMRLQLKNISAKIASDERLKPYRYAILGLSTCPKTSIEDFLPPGQTRFKYVPLEQVFKALYQRAAELREQDRARSIALLGSDTKNDDDYNYSKESAQQRWDELQKGYKNNTYNSYSDYDGLFVAARLKQLIDAAGSSMDDWFMRFDVASRADYTFGNEENLTDLSDYLWKTVLSPRSDPRLYQAFSTAKPCDYDSTFKANSTWGSAACTGGVDLTGSNGEIPTCSILEQKSRETLSGTLSQIAQTACVDPAAQEPIAPRATRALRRVVEKLPQLASPKSSGTKNPVETFKIYCGACHDGPNSLIENLHIKNVSDLKKFRDENGQSMVDKVKLGIMPPKFANYDSAFWKSWEAAKPAFIQQLSK